MGLGWQQRLHGEISQAKDEGARKQMNEPHRIPRGIPTVDAVMHAVVCRTMQPTGSHQADDTPHPIFAHYPHCPHCHVAQLQVPTHAPYIYTYYSPRCPIHTPQPSQNPNHVPCPLASYIQIACVVLQLQHFCIPQAVVPQRRTFLPPRSCSMPQCTSMQT